MISAVSPTQRYHLACLLATSPSAAESLLTICTLLHMLLKFSICHLTGLPCHFIPPWNNSHVLQRNVSCGNILPFKISHKDFKQARKMSSGFSERFGISDCYYSRQQIVCHHHKPAVHSHLFAPFRSSGSFLPCYICGIIISIGNWRSKKTLKRNYMLSNMGTLLVSHLPCCLL